MAKGAVLYDAPSIWKYHISAGSEGVEGSGNVKPDPTPRLFIGDREEVLYELKEEFKALNPDLYDRRGNHFWNDVWIMLVATGTVRIDCGRDPIRGYLVIYVHKFLQMQVEGEV